MESHSAFNEQDFTSNPEKILSEPPVLIEKEKFFDNGINTVVSFSIHQEKFLAYPSIFNHCYCYSRENEAATEQPLDIFNLSTKKQETVLKVAEPSFYGEVWISSVCLYPKNTPNLLITGDRLGRVKFFSLADKNFNLVNSFEVFKETRESDRFLQSIIEDKFREILKDTKEPPILLIASPGTDEPLFIYNMKGENILKIPGIPDGVCRKFDYYHEDSQAKTFLFCGWSNVSVNKFDLSLQKYSLSYPFI